MHESYRIFQNFKWVTTSYMLIHLQPTWTSLYINSKVNYCNTSWISLQVIIRNTRLQSHKFILHLKGPAQLSSCILVPIYRNQLSSPQLQLQQPRQPTPLPYWPSPFIFLPVAWTPSSCLGVLSLGFSSSFLSARFPLSFVVTLLQPFHNFMFLPCCPTDSPAS